MANVLGTIAVKLDAMTAAFSRKMKGVQGVLDKHRQGIQAIGAASTAVAAGIGALGVASTKIAGDFQRSMVRVGAVAQSTDEQLEAMRKEAIKVAADTKFTARDMAEGMQFFAMAGFGVENSMNALRPAAELAAAGAIELGDAANITTSIMAGFGKTTEELTDVNNKMVRAITRAKVDVRGLGESFKFGGPVAKAAGISFEETTAIFAKLGQVGFQGSEAGNQLKQAMIRLLNPSKEVQKTMDRLGISFEEGADGSRSLINVIEQLERSGASAEDVMKIFQARAGPAMSALVGQGSEALRKFTEDLNEGVTATEIATADMETFGGQLDILKSIAEAVAITFGDILIPVVQGFVEKLQGVGKWILNLDSSTQKFIAIAAGIVAVIAAITAGLSGIAMILPFVQFGFVTMGAAVSAALGPVTVIIAALVAGIGATIIAIRLLKVAWRRDIGGIQAKTKAFIDFHKNAFSQFVEMVKWAAKSQMDFFAKAAQFTVDVFTDAINGLIGLLESFVRGNVELFNMLAGTALGKKLGIGAMQAPTFERVEPFDVKEIFDLGGIKGAFQMFKELLVEGGQEMKDELGDAAGDIKDSIAKALGIDKPGAAIPVADPAKALLSDEEKARREMQSAVQETASLAGFWKDSVGKFELAAFEFANNLEDTFEEMAQETKAALAGAGGKLLQALGGAGQLIGGVVEKVASGDVMGGLISGITSLVVKTKAWARLNERFNQAFQSIVNAIEPLIEILEALMGFVSDLVNAVGGLIQMVGMVTKGIAKGLSEVTQAGKKSQRSQLQSLATQKKFADKIRKEVEAHGGIENISVDTIRGFRQMWLQMGGSVQEFAAMIEDLFGEGTAALIAAREEAFDKASELIDDKVARGALDQIVKDIQKNFDGFVSRDLLETIADSFGLSLETLTSFFEEAGLSIEGLDEGMGDLSETVRKVNSELRNVPEGFKIALARFSAIEDTTMPGAGADAATATGDGARAFNVENMTVVANDPQELMDKMESEAEWRNVRQGSSILTATTGRFLVPQGSGG